MISLSNFWFYALSSHFPFHLCFFSKLGSLKKTTIGKFLIKKKFQFYVCDVQSAKTKWATCNCWFWKRVGPFFGKRSRCIHVRKRWLVYGRREAEDRWERRCLKKSIAISEKRNRINQKVWFMQRAPNAHHEHLSLNLLSFLKLFLERECVCVWRGCRERQREGVLSSRCSCNGEGIAAKSAATAESWE